MDKMSDGRVRFRKVSVLRHRYSPLKKWRMDIYTPVYEHVKIDIRLNPKARKVELKTRRDTPDVSNLQKCNDFVQAFMLRFDVPDAVVALLRLDDVPDAVVARDREAVGKRRKDEVRHRERDEDEDRDRGFKDPHNGFFRQYQDL